MKIALIGNINNNNFAMMRYFRDLGVDAHLILYKNDGKHQLDHFAPTNDTWNYGKWASYIHESPLANSYSYAFSEPWIWALNLQQSIYSLIKAKSALYVCSNHRIKSYLSEYGILIGSGISPAICRKIGRSLDIFYPYAIGVEHFATKALLAYRQTANPLSRFVIDRSINVQADGVKSCRLVLNAEVTCTERVLKEIGVNPLRMAIPMVYNREELPTTTGDREVDDVIAELSYHHPSFLAPSRLFWRKPSGYNEEAWVYENKRNDIFFKGFSAAIRLNKEAENSLIIATEYGPDVEETKKLCAALGIQENVRWISIQSRKILSAILPHVDAVVGEFYDAEDMIWGGVGWEALAAGKPLIHGHRFGEGEFEKIYGHPPPNIMAANTEQEVTHQIQSIISSPEKASTAGIQNKKWFDDYNGIGLASRWLQLIT